MEEFIQLEYFLKLLDPEQQSNVVASVLAEENLIMYDKSTQQYVVLGKIDFG